MGTSKFLILFCLSPEAERDLRVLFSCSFVTGGQVSRVDPESTGINPAWRKSLAFTTITMRWQDGANSTEIEAARQLFIQDMKIMEGMAPDSGAYLNEARFSPPPSTNSF